MSDVSDLPKGLKLTPFDPSFQQNPYAVLRTLRERAPVLQDDQFGRWFVTQFEDARQILRDKDVSVDPRKANPNSYARMLLANRPQNGSAAVSSMLFMDDPEHRRLRGLINKAFTAKAVEGLRPRVRAIAQELLAQIHTEEFDLIAAFAAPLPVIVIAEMLGIDPADRSSFKGWSDVGVATFYNPFRTA